MLDKLKKLISKINLNNNYNELKLLLMIHPEPYARPRKSRKLELLGKHNVFYNPRQKFKNKLIKEIKNQLPDDFECIEGEVVLNLIFGITAPKSISNSETKSALIYEDILHPLTRPDIDNYSKVILDALNNLVFEDDSQVFELNSKKVYVVKEEDEFISIHLRYRQKPIKLR